MRFANVAWKGAQITCILTSRRGNAQVPATGRQWYETEYCIDPATDPLDIASIAPGVYTVYDYTNSLSFHGRVMPGTVTITENGAPVVSAQLTSISDFDPKNTTFFTPSAQMIAQGPATMLMQPTRFPVQVNLPAPGAVVQPVIVHAVIDSPGAVKESEALQTSSMSEAALALVKGMTFSDTQPAAGASPTEREAYINVRFRPAEQ